MPMGKWQIELWKNLYIFTNISRKKRKTPETFLNLIENSNDFYSETSELLNCDFNFVNVFKKA